MAHTDDSLRSQSQPGDPKLAAKVQRMIRPEALKKAEPLLWSAGIGTDVWEMFCAAMTGDVDSITRLLARDPSLVRAAHAYHTPLYFAVRENQLEAVRLLLEHGADPIWGMDDNLLDIARDRGYVEVLELLQRTLSDQHGASPRGEEIAEAIRSGNLTKVRELLDADPDLIHAGDRRSNQPIHWAVMSRQIEMIDELLSRGADINAKRSDGARPIQLTNGDYHYRGWRDVPKETPTPKEVLDHLRQRGAYCDICTAACIGDIDRVKELLEEDASLSNRPSDYVTYYACSGTPLRNAAAGGHLELVKLLLDRGADPNLPEEGIAPQGHALYSAVYNGHHEVARLLLERGAHPNPAVESSADALSIALMNSDQKMADLLCSYGAARSVEILAYYNDIRTAAAAFAANPSLADDVDGFRCAAEQGHEGFVRLMLRYRPDLPKRVAAAGGTRKLTELLFEHGMDANKPNWLRVTPLHGFSRSGDVESAALFLEHGADLNARDEHLCATPLAWAAKSGKARMAEFLLRRGAKLSLVDDPPWATPLAWAMSRGHEKIVALLKDYEATGVLPSINVEQYELLAQDFVDAYNSGDTDALERIGAWFQLDRRLDRDRLRGLVSGRLGRKSEAGESDRLPLSDARLLVARAHGFQNWAEISAHETGEESS
jgi:ankyrin repeat protein